MNITYILGLVILIGFGLCSLFMAIDGLGLQSQQAIATIMDREHRDAVMGQRIEIINQKPVVTPHVTDEKYILKLDIDGRQTEGAVSRNLFETVRPGEQVRVTFQERRLTGRIQVLEVTQ